MAAAALCASVAACGPLGGSPQAGQSAPASGASSAPAGDAIPGSTSAAPTTATATTGPAPSGNEVAIPAGGSIQGWFGTNFPRPGDKGGDPGGGGMGQHMQDWCNAVRVMAKGVQCTSSWDEGHHENAIYDVNNGRFLDKGVAFDNSDVTDAKGKHWKIRNLKYLGGDAVTGDGGCTVTDGSGFRPNGLGLSNDGLVMVADNGPDQQIKLVDPTTCKITKTFGEKGGVFAPGQPRGVTGPTRFYGLTGTGMASNGDFIQGGIIPGGGSWLSRVTPDGKIVWRNYGDVFLTSPGFDLTTDGHDAYSITSHYKLDYSRTPDRDLAGEFPYAFTTDIFAHPDDPTLRVGKWKNPLELGADSRLVEHPVSSAGVVAVQVIKGKRYIFTSGQNGPGLGAHRFDGETEINMPLGIKGSLGRWGYYVDTAGSIWSVSEDNREKIWRWRLKGTDADGNLQYGEDARDEYDFPTDANFNSLERVYYDVANDRLFLSGFTKAHPKLYGWGMAGTEVHRYDGWVSGKKTTFPTVILKHTSVGKGNGDGGIGDHDAEKSLAVQNVVIGGTYVVASYGSVGPMGGHGEHEVYDSTTGKLVQNLTLDSKLRKAANAGWLDLTNPSTVIQRANGECVLASEDDAFNAYLYYRFSCK